MIYWNVFAFTRFSCSVVWVYCERGDWDFMKRRVVIVVVVILPHVANYPVFIAQYLHDRNLKILNLQIIKTEQECYVLLWALLICIFLLSPLVFWTMHVARRVQPVRYCTWPVTYVNQMFCFSAVGSAYSKNNMLQMAQQLVTCSGHTLVCNWLVGFCNRDSVCLLCGMDWVFKYNSC